MHNTYNIEAYFEFYEYLEYIIPLMCRDGLLQTILFW